MITNDWIYGIFYWTDALFPLELFLAESVFYSLLRRRERFGPRLLLSVLLYSLFVLFVPPYIGAGYQFTLPENWFSLLYSTAYCVAIFMLSVAVALITYQEAPRTVMFCAIAGYCVQHIAFRVMETLFVFLPVGTGAVRYGARFLLDAVIFGVILAALKRKLKIDELRVMSSKKVVGFSLVVLFVTVLLTMFSRVEEVGPVTDIVEAIYSSMSCIFVLMLQLNVFRRLELVNRADTIERMWEQDREHYRLSNAYAKDIEVKAHDLKYAISALRQKYSGDFVEEAEKALSVFGSLYDTGNEALDVILSEKALFCSQADIHLTCMVDGRELGFIQDSDLYFCLGNALDNAITAVSKLENPEKKIISISLRREKDFLSLHIENFFDGALSVKSGFPETSKADKKNHGFGMQSIETVAKKYGGHMTFSAAGDVFSLNILFPLPRATDFGS